QELERLADRLPAYLVSLHQFVFRGQLGACRQLAAVDLLEQIAIHHIVFFSHLVHQHCIDIITNFPRFPWTCIEIMLLKTFCFVKAHFGIVRISCCGAHRRRCCAPPGPVSRIPQEISALTAIRPANSSMAASMPKAWVTADITRGVKIPRT